MGTNQTRVEESAAEAKSQADLFEKCRKFTRAKDAQAAGLYPYFVAISDSEGTEVRINGQRKIMLGSNNYLGLTHDPRVMEAAEKVAHRYGTGCTGSRFLNGTLDLHEKLEEELADYIGKPAAIVFSTGFQTNLGIISCLCGRGDVVVIDKLDHACIVDGAQLAGSTVYRYNHNDMFHLEKLLQKARRLHPKGGILVVVDGIFSMEGDLADLPHVLPLVHQYGARLLVDEAHSMGVIGPNGAGVADHFGLTPETDLIMGTFSKSFASIGGVAAGEERVIHFIKHHARTMIFSASMPPYAVATVRECLRIMRAEPERRERLWRNTARLQDGLRAMGFDTAQTASPIVPIIVGDLEKTFVFWKVLLDMGVFTNPVIAPAVPENSSRIRTSLMATHTDALVDEALDIIGKAGKQVGLI
jgi:8-amino-7-oxononanoate synthase